MVMSWTNQSTVSEFLLLGLFWKPQLQQILITLFLTMYLATFLGNLLIILAISTDSRLHTPMYFFLSNLSFVDLCISSTIVPNMLINHILSSHTISFPGCLTQMYFFIMFISMDNFLLAVMAYDRFVAICHPLHYTTKMTHQLCALMVSGCWVIANGNALLHTLLMARLSFCADNRIPHFFCDVAPLLKLSCSDTHINEMVINTDGVLIMITPFICILVSYICITTAVLRVPSTKGKWKAFSTCGSHLAVVSLFYGTIIAVYFTPSSSHSAEKDIAAAVMYTVVTPMLNPFIYSLRNKDMKGALTKLSYRSILSTLFSKTDLFILLTIHVMDHCLLAVMAYDHFVAVCHSLHYTTKMEQLCSLLLAGISVITNQDALFIPY
ncbi:olfactory receptor 1F1-like [Tenrec ecaudatus]|uniref:olfactory receptor 1F1-like n=1 Tax=Tenrec ecaudatus TaxID=94439 RepID=UPI003F59AC07